MYDPNLAALCVLPAEQGIPVLMVANQELAPWVHSPQGRAVLALPGRVVPIVRGALRPGQVGYHRPSYINGILIQSQGVVQDPPCARCEERLRPFTECRRVPGHFGGCCGNCKWPDAAASCTARNPNETSVQVIKEDHLLEGPREGDQDNPIVLQ